MKSFDKFQYGRTDLHELKIGERMSSVGSGIQRTMAKTRLKARARLAKRGLSSDKGRFAGRAAAGAGQEVLGYKPDTERTDTQQGGMGTALRASGGFGRSIVKGAINAPSERIDPNKRKTAGGRLLARTKEKLQKKFGIQRTPRTKRGRQVTDNFDRLEPETVFGKKGEGEKSGITNLGKPANTPVGKTKERPGVLVTGKKKIERLKQFRRDQLEKKRTGVPGQRSPASIDTDRSSKTPEQSILSAKRRNTNRQIKNISRDPQQKIVDRQMKQAENEIKTNPKTGRQMIRTGNRTSPEDNLMQGVNTQANKDTVDQFGGNQTSKPKRGRGRPKGSTGRRATRSTPEEQANNQRIANRIKNRSATTTPRKATETTVNRNETSSEPKQLSIDGLNIGGTKASGRLKTQNKKNVEPVMRQSNQLNLDGSKDKPKLVNKNTGRELNKNKENKTLKQNDPKNNKNKETKVNESTNRIAAQRQMKKELPNQGKMRTVDQMDDDKAKQAALQKSRQKGLMYRSSDTLNDSVQYSDWREEFLWEVDKKYPEKVKEIKPMSGKNTITINPEDETSKYKRGY